MKKIKIIVAAILRGALLLSPGVVFYLWQWGKVSALVNILAAIGLESLFLMIFSFIAVAINVAREKAGKRAASGDDEISAVETTE